MKSILGNAKEIHGIKFLCISMNNVENAVLNFISNSFRCSTTPLITLFIYKEGKKGLLISTVSKDCFPFIDAVGLIKLAEGSGGGKQGIARGVIRNLKNCEEVLHSTEICIIQKIKEYCTRPEGFEPPTT